MAEKEHRGEELYNLASEPELAKPARAAANAEAQPARVLAYQGEKPASGLDPDRLKNLHAPLALFAGGLLVQAAVIFFSSSVISLSQRYSQAGLDLVVSTVLMLLVFRWCASRRGFDFGKVADAVLKVMAVSVAPSSAMYVMGIAFWFIPFGWLLAWVLAICFYFALVGYFFDLEQDDTWYCVFALFLTRIAVSVAWHLLS